VHVEGRGAASLETEPALVPRMTVSTEASEMAKSVVAERMEV